MSSKGIVPRGRKGNEHEISPFTGKVDIARASPRVQFLQELLTALQCCNLAWIRLSGWNISATSLFPIAAKCEDILSHFLALALERTSLLLKTSLLRELLAFMDRFAFKHGNVCKRPIRLKRLAGLSGNQESHDRAASIGVRCHENPRMTPLLH
eukprot:scaffold465_cov383-Pavlova_lutheri.AAC.10